MTFLFAPSLSGWHNRRIPHLFRHGNGELTLLGNLCTLFVAKSYPINKPFALVQHGGPLPRRLCGYIGYVACRVRVGAQTASTDSSADGSAARSVWPRWRGKSSHS